MLDLKMIRTEPDKVKAAIQKREMNLDSVIDEILKIDVDRRAVTGKVEAKKAEQNAASKQIPAMKKAGQDTTELMAQMKVLSAEIKEYDAELGELEEKGWALFFFQYLYYLFEVGLVLLIVAFGQAFAEGLLGRQSPIPFGGLLLCCTWGAVHILSRGSLQAGLGTMAFSLLYGGIYLLLGRNAGYSYTAMALAFIL